MEEKIKNMFKMLKKAVSGILALSMCLNITATGAENETKQADDTMKTLAQKIEFYDNIIEKQLEFIASTQMKSGALIDNLAASKKYKVTPYFADFQAIALLTRPEKYKDNVKRYIDWHMAHLNTAEEDQYGVDGTIYDYYIDCTVPGTEKETISTDADGVKRYDSTDSYAATFLDVLWTYADKTGDTLYIAKQIDNIERIIDAMFATYDNGLTYAHKGYQVKYLMDNCEVYKGIQSTLLLYKNVLSPIYKKNAEKTALINKRIASLEIYEEEMLTAFRNQLAVPKSPCYYPYLGANAPDMTLFYPDATSQIFPIIMEVFPANGYKAKDIYKVFNDNFSTDIPGRNWENIDKGDLYLWGIIARAAVMMDDFTRLDIFLKNYKEKFADKGNPWPAINPDIAHIVIASDIAREKTADKIDTNDAVIEKINGIAVTEETADVYTFTVDEKQEKIKITAESTGYDVELFADENLKFPVKDNVVSLKYSNLVTIYAKLKSNLTVTNKYKVCKIKIKPETVKKYTFTDLESHWAKTEYEKIKNLCIINGKEENKFCPDDNTLRSEAAAMIIRALQYDASQFSSGIKFDDDELIPSWAREYVEACTALNIINGSSNEDGTVTFNAESPITRVEFMAVLVRAMKLEIRDNTELKFSDKDEIPSWAVDIVKTAYANGIVGGDENNNIQPNDCIKRGEIVAMIARALPIKQNG